MDFFKEAILDICILFYFGWVQLSSRKYITCNSWLILEPFDNMAVPSTTNKNLEEHNKLDKS